MLWRKQPALCSSTPPEKFQRYEGHFRPQKQKILKTDLGKVPSRVRVPRIVICFESEKIGELMVIASFRLTVVFR